jgi:hypothetical protein
VIKSAEFRKNKISLDVERISNEENKYFGKISSIKKSGISELKINNKVIRMSDPNSFEIGQ